MSKFTDKFLDMMRLNSDDDDYDYDDYDDEEEDFKPVNAKSERQRASTPRRSRSSEMEELKGTKEKEVRETREFPRQTSRPATKVVPMRNRKNAGGMEVCVIKPTSVDDAREITDTLLSGRAVILNMEGIHFELAQRIIDFTSGSCYSINGNLRKVSNYIFIITPETVDISGDFQELLDGNVNVTSV